MDDDSMPLHSPGAIFPSTKNLRAPPMAVPVCAFYTGRMLTVAQILGRNLRRIRKGLGLTQEEFREQTGVSQSYLSELETGKSWVALRALCEQIKAVGGDPLDLVRPPDEEPDPTVRDILRAVRDLDDDARRDLLAIARRLRR